MDEIRAISMALGDELFSLARQSSGPNANPFARVHPFVYFRRLFTEAVGTFLLVAVDCGGAMIASMSHGEVTSVARSLATGMVVMAMIATMGDVSGAHFNPAVTCAFAIRRAFPWSKVPPYVLAQLAGAFAAAGFLRAVFGDVARLGTTLPGFGAGRAFAMEVLLTTALVLVSLGTATRHRVLGPNAAIAVGGTIATCSLFSRPISGASMNPARSLAPAAVSGTTQDLWIYLVAPLVGACVGCAIMHVVHHRRHREEREAAGGEPK
jgi:MIP family channel proteins